MDAVGVNALLQQLKSKLAMLDQSIQSDADTKGALERSLARYTDQLEETDGLLRTQKKLQRKYNNQLDEAEMSIAHLKKASGKFQQSYLKISKQDKGIDM